MSKGAIIFDGDDTLWMTQPIYKSVIDDFYAVLEQQGFNLRDAHLLFNSINEELLKTIKLSTDRLGRAMTETYKVLCERTGTLIRSSISKELIELAKQVYIRAPQPLDGLHKVLSTLAKDFELFFYSGGATTTQHSRLAKLDLDQYFDKREFIVTQKDDATLDSILKSHDLNPKMTWIVGNSLRFEINPGTRLGLNCIWMHTSFWKLDLEDVCSRTFVAFSLHEVPNILAYKSGFAQVYNPSMPEALELQSILSNFSNHIDVWVVGTSPKLDVNPASSFGVNLIWIPTAFSSNDIEPFNSSMFIAFSPDGAEKIIKQWSNGKVDPTKIVWRMHRQPGDRGGSLIIE